MNLRMFAVGAFVLSLVATSVQGEEPQPSAPPASVPWTDASQRVAKGDAPLYLQVHAGATGRLALRSFSPAMGSGAWADLGEWSLSGEPKAQMDALKALHASIAKAIDVPAQPVFREDDGSSRVVLLVDAEPTAPWRSVQWVVATASSPQTKVYRLSFLTSVPGEALDVDLPKDNSGRGNFGEVEDAVWVAVRMFRKGLGGTDEKPWTRIKLEKRSARAFVGGGPVEEAEIEDDVPAPAKSQPRIAAVLEFRIEVLPEEEYARFGVDETVKRTRFRVWPGTADEFYAFKRTEVAHWQEADSMGVAYVPSRPPLRLVPRASSPAKRTTPEQFAVVEVPQDASERFGGHILANVGVSSGETQEPVTTFEVKPAYRDAFERWTAKNVGLPMAILVSGEYRTAPRVITALRDHVQVTLGMRDWDTARREAEALQKALQALPAEPPPSPSAASSANTFDLPLADAPSGVHAARWHEFAARVREIAGEAKRRFGEIKAPFPTGQAVPYADVIGVMRLLFAAGCEDVFFEGAAAPLMRKDGGGWGFGR